LFRGPIKKKGQKPPGALAKKTGRKNLIKNVYLFSRGQNLGGGRRKKTKNRKKNNKQKKKKKGKKQNADPPWGVTGEAGVEGKVMWGHGGMEKAGERVKNGVARGGRS